MDIQLFERLLSLDTASFCDSNKNIRVLSPDISRINPGEVKLIGKAHTVYCRDDFLTVIKALKEARSGEVLVIDAGGGHKAMAGELFASEALQKKLAGIVIDGACRDSHALKKLKIPIYSRYIHPLSGTTNKIFNTQIPVVCGGVIVNPGDLIFGDNDGVIVFSRDELNSLLEEAESIQTCEEEILTQINEGKSLLDLLNFEEHYQNINASKPSQLRFIV